MLKRILFTALSLILAYNTYKLASILFVLPPEEFSLLAIITSSLAFNILITGAVAFLGFVYPTSKLISNSYYRIHNPKIINTLYKYLGVSVFRSFLLITFYREKDNQKYFDGSKSGIVTFYYNTKQSEFGHLIAFNLVIALSLLLLLEGHTQVFIWIQPLNIFLNFYPIILQRKHRIIVERLIGRINKAASK